MIYRTIRISLSVFILLITIQLPFFSIYAQEVIMNNHLPSIENPDLLIFISPQYSLDIDIRKSINSYTMAVKSDLNWISQLILISQNENNYQFIDTLIEKYFMKHPVKACIMVGEDLDTALGGDCDYLEQPSILPWSTLGGNTSYKSTKQGIVCKLSRCDICISLLYPTHNLSYEEKKSHIIFAFHKFTLQRFKKYPSIIRVFESTDLNNKSKLIYQNLDQQRKVQYYEDASESEFESFFTKPCVAFFVHGHSTPAGTDINAQQKTGWFNAENIDILKTPLFGADGCYTSGWWSNYRDNDKLDDSVGTSWYGSKIFTSTDVQVMLLGLLTQNGVSTPVSYIENVMLELLTGKTLAEAIIGDFFLGDVIIVGDPTFHFSI